MHKTRRGLRSSRRAETLQDADIDHEIVIIDHDASDSDGAPRPSLGSSVGHDTSMSNQPLAPSSQSTAPLITSSTKATIESAASDAAAPQGQQAAGAENGTHSGNAEAPNHTQPSIVIDHPTPNERRRSEARPGARARPVTATEPETAIDILYENERGCFLCGIPLFAGAALGNLDPPPWTNFAHKASPTNIHNAQVPDPSWQWAWPEWRINRDETIDTDADGWEYSFMFSKHFSWHGPRWYNSFVRRRAWIRRRVKKGVGYQPNDPHIMNDDYFRVTPKQKPELIIRSQSASRTSSVADRLSLTTLPRLSVERSRSPASTRDSRRSGFFRDLDELDEKPDILRVEDLIVLLRKSRIDREKLEAVENYIKNSQDDLRLEEHIHEIMSIFVFQASRKLLLTRLMQIYDDLAEAKGKDKAGQENEGQQSDDDGLERRKANLSAAIKHADEEVRKLEYWSDIKSMAENGQSGGAVECGKGWKQGWEGLDKSGAKGARNEELPAPNPREEDKTCADDKDE